MLAAMIPRSLLLAVAGLSLLASSVRADSDARIPEVLRPWEAWTLWNDRDFGSPSPFNNPERLLPFWPSSVSLAVTSDGGTFTFGVTAFREGWIPLPGDPEHWPAGVKVDGKPAPVLDRGGVPHVLVSAGTRRIEGNFVWSETPQRLRIPQEVGILSLKLDGKDVPIPSWSPDGTLWLRRDAITEVVGKDHLEVKVYGLIEDGIPLWLRLRVELIVSGKSREERIGVVLPEGWRIASVNGPIPVAVDDAGFLKAQVRAGKWTVAVDAFRIDHPAQLRFGSGVALAAREALIAFKANPEFRLVDISGVQQVDAAQTTFPQDWRNFPVYRWELATPLEIVERLRGQGSEQPPGLGIQREFWLDDDGRALTFRDTITGKGQRIWRLDAAAGQDLGAVRSNGEGQLITRNPENGAPGFEVRSRDFAFEAVGRMSNTQRLTATGWRADAETLTTRWNLPPGWRLFALFGADWVRGDWLTAWSLLDLFVLLVFTLAVRRLWGNRAAVLAFLGLVLSYHEPGAPRFLWLALLVPLALLRVLPAGWGRRLVLVWKWATVLALAFVLIPFLSAQVQQALFPQLEQHDNNTDEIAFPSSGLVTQTEASSVVAQAADEAAPSRGARQRESPGLTKEKAHQIKAFAGGWGRAAEGGNAANLANDPQARIQTGPAVPEWDWRQISFGWNGPVRATQEIRVILIPRSLERCLSALRVALLILLPMILVRGRNGRGTALRPGIAAILGGLIVFVPGPTAQAADFPTPELLNSLREKLVEKSEAYPNAAAIPLAALRVTESGLEMNLEVHAGTETAVPLPGRLPAWVPARVTVDGQSWPSLRRDGGFLWIVLPKGVHQVRVEGLLPGVTEWEWAFLLRPMRVEIDAPGWTVSGIRTGGIPDQQVFFVREQKVAPEDSEYDRQDFQNVVQVRRHLELGLVWQVQTTVRRLSPPGRAIFQRIPLLEGERVLTGNVVVKEGQIEVRLGAQETTFSWTSELPVTPEVTLRTRPSDAWVETWALTVSPVWNVAFSGLAPVFTPDAPNLVPVWQPWPGEEVDLLVSRPEAIPGPTTTVLRVNRKTTLGTRQKITQLALSLRCTLGEDFPILLPDEADVTSLSLNGKTIPVRREKGDRGAVIIPIRPGESNIHMEWKTDQILGFRATSDSAGLSIPAANMVDIIEVPEGRWTLWAQGPLRGPAVRFWIVLACAGIAALILGRMRSSPLKTGEWALLALGLTQVSLTFALIVVGWLFFLAWRGKPSYAALPTKFFNILQVLLLVATGAALIVFVAIVGAGLLGDPEMFILGNGSSANALQWFDPLPGQTLPVTAVMTVSIWWYRVLMLLWALWLASSLIRWLRWGWGEFSAGGCFRRGGTSAKPPPIP